MNYFHIYMKHENYEARIRRYFKYFISVPHLQFGAGETESFACKVNFDGHSLPLTNDLIPLKWSSFSFETIICGQFWTIRIPSKDDDVLDVKFFVPIFSVVDFFWNLNHAALMMMMIVTLAEKIKTS